MKRKKMLEDIKEVHFNFCLRFTKTNAITLGFSFK